MGVGSRESGERERVVSSPSLPVGEKGTRGAEGSFPRWRRLLYQQKYVAFVFIAPSLLFLVVFVVLPIIAALALSFSQFNLLKPPRWIGLANYAALLGDDRFIHSILNTLIFALVTIPTGTALALVFALFVNQQLRGIVFFRAAFYMPVVTSFVAVSLVWLWLYDQNFGLLNALLSAIHQKPLGWLQDPTLALPSIIIMSVWKNIGYNMVIYLAGLQGIPEHLYESAELDGAGRWAKFWSITLPLLSPTTFFVVVIWFIGALQMFVQVLVMTQGGPLDSTITVVYLVYSNAFENLKMGYAAAMSFALFAFIGIVTYLNTRILSYDVTY